MKKKILALACAVACVSVFTAVFAACSGDGGGTEVEVPEGMKVSKMEKGDVAAYKEVPLMLVLKSDVAVRKAQAVIASMMEDKGIEKA